MKRAANVEILQPPIPTAALLAKPTSAPASPGLEKQVADLRELETRLSARVESLERLVAERGTVCCVCGKPDCHEAPHVPMRFWMRYGRAGWDYYRAEDSNGARQSEREYYYRDRNAPPRPSTIPEEMWLSMADNYAQQRSNRGRF